MADPLPFYIRKDDPRAKREILRAAMKLFSERGLAATSIREPLATLLHDVHHKVDRDIHFVTKCRTIAASAIGYHVEGPPRW